LDFKGHFGGFVSAPQNPVSRKQETAVSRDAVRMLRSADIIFRFLRCVELQYPSLTDAKAAAKDEGIPGGVLEVGTLETTAAIRLPSILASFAKTYPKVRLVVTTGTTCSLIEDVVECRLEGALVAGPVDHPNLQQESVFREELVLVTPRSIRSIEDLPSIPDLKTIVFRWTIC
jgi:DNA-binding transcriptional LysR family regulator